MTKIITLFLILLGSACGFATSNVQSRQSSDLEARKVRRIAVMPPPPMAQETNPVPYPLKPGGEPKAPEREAPELLARSVYAVMASLPRWQIISQSEVQEVGQTVPAGNEVSRVARIGAMVYADAVITGRVQRYRERVGDEWGAKSPASVAFVLELIDVRRGDIIWSARFDETQKPLSENILALGDIGRRGVKWLSAEQLMHEGVKKAVGQLHQILVPNSAS